MVKTAAIHIRIEPELKKLADRAAKDDNRSTASLVERAIVELLEGRGYLAKRKATKARK